MKVLIPLLLISGLLINGPYALITTAVSTDLGTHPSLTGNAKALATVTAIIDGTGSMGAAFGTNKSNTNCKIYKHQKLDRWKKPRKTRKNREKNRKKNEKKIAKKTEKKNRKKIGKKQKKKISHKKILKENFDSKQWKRTKWSKTLTCNKKVYVGPMAAGLIAADGWGTTFYSLIGAQLIALLCLVRLIYREMKGWSAARRLRQFGAD